MKGITPELKLVNGKFALLDGSDKVQANVRTFLRYHDWFRVYKQDFCIQLVGLVQKPITYLLSVRTLYMGRISGVISKYLPYVITDKMNIRITKKKEIAIFVSYRITFSDTVPTNQVEFLAP